MTDQSNTQDIDIKTKGITMSIPVAVLAVLLPVVSQIVVSCNTGSGALKTQLDQQTSDIKEIKEQVRQISAEQKGLNEKVIKDGQDLTNRVLLLEFKGGVVK